MPDASFLFLAPMQSLIHSLAPSFIHFMGLCCALKCVGTGLDAEKVKMSKLRTLPYRRSLSCS